MGPGKTSRQIKHLDHPPVPFSRIRLATFVITPYVVTVYVFLSVNKTYILKIIVFSTFSYNFTMVNVLFEIRKWSKVHNNNQIVLMCYAMDQHTGLHICTKRICDRSSSFTIIHQKACRSYGEQDSSLCSASLPVIFNVLIMF
jgi:hypothetical protein